MLTPGSPPEAPVPFRVAEDAAVPGSLRTVAEACATIQPEVTAKDKHPTNFKHEKT